MKQVVRSVFVALTLFFFAACASGKAIGIEELPPGQAPQLQTDRAIAFGRVQIIENGVKQLSYPAPSFANIPFSVGVVGGDRESYISKKLESDGAFYWIVPRERREIKFVQYRTTGFVEPRIAFQATQGVGACYLGVLIVDIETEEKMLKRVKIKKVNSISIKDDFEEDASRFISRHPGHSNKIEKCLMIIDASIPFGGSRNVDLMMILPFAAAILVF